MALIFNSWLLELAAVVVTLLAGVYAYFNHRFNYWKKRGVASLPPSFPLGNISDIILQRRTMGDVIQSIYKQLDGHKLAGFYTLATPTLMVRDPEYIKYILVKDFAHFHDHGTYFDEKSDPLSAHLFSMEGTKWKHLRTKLTPTFTSGKMKMMFPAVLECGTELQEHFIGIAEREETIELKGVFAKYGIDVISTCAFGIQTNSLKNPDSEFRRLGTKIFEPSFHNAVRDALTFFVPSIAAIFKIPSAPREVSDFFRGVVKETVSYREKNNVTRKDFLQLLIRIKNKKSVTDENDPQGVNDETSENYYDIHGLTDDELAAQAFVFFMGGFETSSTTMSFALYELAINQEFQDRLRNEVDSVLADCEGQLTYEAMMRMTYMDRVIAEILRKYPPAGALFRTCNQEYKVPGTELVIEKGTSIMIPVVALHYDPQYFPDPDRFNPDRFTEEAKSESHRYVYLPFGEGPRNCIGSRFALMQTKVGLATLLQKYQFNVCKKLTPMPLIMDPRSFMPNPIGGMNLQIIPRK